MGKWYNSFNKKGHYFFRFVVQKLEGLSLEPHFYKDLKEFSKLDEARAYKRELELEAGG